MLNALTLLSASCDLPVWQDLGCVLLFQLHWTPKSLCMALIEELGSKVLAAAS